MGNIQAIIKKLGYEKSTNLFYLSQINTCSQLSWHDRRVVEALAPYAVYVTDGNILVAFFDDLYDRENIQCKIWNAQIPVIISDEGDWIKVYNGKNIDIDRQKKMKLKDIASYQEDQCCETNCFSYWNLTNSSVLDMYENSLAKKSFNDFLKDNLKYITTELKDRYNISFANKFVLRILFIRYMIDRGICIGFEGLNGDIEESQENFLRIVKKKNKLFLLFKYLKEKFNGNLFDIDEQKERYEISDLALTMLYDFLTAKIELRTGQLCLFPFYDFNIIPIELISNIYEILLGKEKQDKDKAFYTPEYLADYIVQRSIGKRLRISNECKVLDPACGSGIFLVKSLRMILEKNASDDGFLSNKNDINRLIKNNIYGVDYNEEAVDVTIFSLYITLFDYQDPKSLNEFKLPLLRSENIICGDFFENSTLQLIENLKFDYIIGNPPWGRVEQKNYMKYCLEKDVNPQDGEICVAFLLKVQEVGNEQTECSLIIPSKILYKGKKPSLDLRRRILDSVTIDQVLELSAVRKQIFKEANAPAAILTFKCHKSMDDHKVEYISVKPNKYIRLFGVIMVEPDDVKYVEQRLLTQHDELWKILVYGGYWDYELLSGLWKKYPKINQIEKTYKLQRGKGIQDHKGDGKDSSHLVGRKLLNSDGCIEHFKLNLDNLEVFNKIEIHRPREKELFEPPYVFFKKGLDCEDFSIKAVYTEERLVYKETINCIKGTKENENILLNFAGLFNSSLFAYFNLMLGSSVGIEREQIFLKEIETFPYVYSDELVKLVKKIQDYSSKGLDIELFQPELNACVLKMYGLDNNYFVDYALNIQIPMLCGHYTDFRCGVEQLQKYAEVFISVWENRLERSGVFYSIDLYPDIKGRFAAFKMQLSFSGVASSIRVAELNSDDINWLTDIVISKLNDGFYSIQNVVEYDNDSFYIVKPISFKYWHPSLAIKDSYRVLNEILLGEENL